MKHLIYILFLFPFPILIKGQQPVKGTNVDPSYLRPKWMGANLASLTFRNGDKIRVVKDLDEWKSSTGKVNTPTVLIKKTNTGDEYYYNYYAITDKRNIIPIGYKLPVLTDFNPRNIDFDLSNRGKKLEDSSILHLAPYGFVDWDGNLLRFQFFNPEENSLFLWTSEPFENSNEFWKVANIQKGASQVEVRPSPGVRTAGYIVRCVEDFEPRIKNQLFEYKLLLPSNFEAIKDSIRVTIRNTHNIIVGSKLRVSAEIAFDDNGRNISRILEFSPKENSEDAINLLTSIIKNVPIAPYYHSLSLKAKSSLIIEIYSGKGGNSAFFPDSVNVTSANVDPNKKIVKQLDALLQKEKELTQQTQLREKESQKAEQNLKKQQAKEEEERLEKEEAERLEREKRQRAEEEKERLEREKQTKKSTAEYQRQVAHLDKKRKREERINSTQEYEINGRMVIKHYLGIALGTTHPILEFAGVNPFSGTTHSGFGQSGFSASIDGAFRVRNGFGIKLKADAMSFNFNTSAYERNILSPIYTIQDKSKAIVTQHYYLIQNLMVGINFNIGKYKFLFEVSGVGGITTGFGPQFKYLSNYYSSIQNSPNKFLVGFGYQLAGAFRIRCTSTFAVKIGASYLESRIPNYIGQSTDKYGYYNDGTLIIRAIVPQISLVGLFFHSK